LALALAVTLTWSGRSPALATSTLADHFGGFASDSQELLDHSPWNRFLTAYLVGSDDGIHRVAYSQVTAEDQASLKHYLEDLQAIDPTQMTRDQQFAYWVNLYNALSVDLVIDHYPVSSIRRIKFGWSLKPGPWDKKLLNVLGRELSLNNIEHDILRAIWNDARIHYAVNCASLSCPNLRHQAWTSVGLDDQLNQAARDYVNHPRGVSLEGSALKVSSIYIWYRSDFGGSDRAVIEHLTSYDEPELAAALNDLTAISGHDYDWKLNDHVPSGAANE
jgi:hypothetical protein